MGIPVREATSDIPLSLLIQQRRPILLELIRYSAKPSVYWAVNYRSHSDLLTFCQRRTKTAHFWRVKIAHPNPVVMNSVYDARASFAFLRERGGYSSAP